MFNKLLILLVSLTSMATLDAQDVYRSSSIIPKYYFGETRVSTYAMKQIVGEDALAAKKLKASFYYSVAAWSGFTISASSLFWRYLRKNNGARNLKLQSGMAIGGGVISLIGALTAVHQRNMAIQVFNDAQSEGESYFISPSSEGLGICFHF